MVLKEFTQYDTTWRIQYYNQLVYSYGKRIGITITKLCQKLYVQFKYRGK